MSIELRRCSKGHVKELRRYGWYCRICHRANQQKREADAIAAGLRPPTRPRGTTDSVPVPDRCKRGHQKVRRPNGDLTCPTCVNAWKAARRQAERLKTCEHAEQCGFQGILSTRGKMVCLACLVAEVDARQKAAS